MRLQITSACILYMFLLGACSKDPNTTPPAIAKKKISLELNFQAETPDNKWEFIVSNASGLIILDTIANANSKSFFVYYTNEQSVDLTFIYKDRNDSKFYMGTYRGVDPTGWDNLEIPIFGYLDQT